MIDEEAIDRIRRMEVCFDALTAALREGAAPSEGELALLRRYYEEGQWLKDYELDERGLLPEDLKRGVLSQDGVYDLLAALSAQKAPEESE